MRGLPIVLCSVAGIAAAVAGVGLSQKLRTPKPISQSINAPEKTDFSKQRTVADAIDKLIDARFQIVDGKTFGESRIVEIDGHGRISENFAPEGKTEESLMQIANAPKLGYYFGFLHLGHAMAGKHDSEERKYLKEQIGRVDHLHSSPVDVLASEADYNRLQAFGRSVASRATHGEAFETADGKYVAFVRPVKATQASCVGCHTEAKRGDTLGAMIYWVAK
jgi:hypothetical protein